MSLRLLIVNCNNTIRESILDPGGYINSPKDQRIIPGAINALKQLDVTWTAVAIHNCGGLTAIDKTTDKAYKSRADSIAEQRYTIKLLATIKAIKAVYVCPNFFGNGRNCWRITSRTVREYSEGNYRIPNPGMLQLAVDQYSNTKTKNIIYVGDDDTDAEAAIAADIDFKWARDWWRETVE